MKVPQHVKEELKAKENVTGVGYGRKRRNGERIREDAVIVFVREKVSKDDLDPEDVVPEKVPVQLYEDDRVRDRSRTRKLEAVTDVIEVGEVVAQSGEEIDRTSRHRPFPMGVSIGHPEVTAGTAGLLVEKNGTNFVLTNAHVAAPPGEWSPGDPIYQPGVYDGGDGNDRIGFVSEASRIDPDEPNRTDSALVRIQDDAAKDAIAELGELEEFDKSYSDTDTFVKSGRTTGVREGEVLAEDVEIEVGGYYDEPVTFEQVDVFTTMSDSGDSGSGVCIRAVSQPDDPKVLATHLLFAGSPQVTIAIPIRNVFAEHGVLHPVSPEDVDRAEGSLTLISVLRRLWNWFFGRR